MTVTTAADAQAAAKAREREVAQEDIASTRDALELLHQIAQDGVLRGDARDQIVPAIPLVERFLASLKSAVSGPGYPADDLVLMCEKDRTPHAMKFHRMHTEAP